jgi:hypothetical protein
VDANDIFYPWVIYGSRAKERVAEVAAALTDNPMSQVDECTPMGLLRRLK